MNIKDLILAAKHRVVEDLFALVACGDSADENNYGDLPDSERYRFRRDLSNLNQLMQLDEFNWSSLQTLHEAGYWETCDLSNFSPYENSLREQCPSLYRHLL